uniref:Uncharacterized protein n=1 Tax=Globodera rostochiensis TaxID=31243 RepID=A0A914I0B9_GLORO
MSSGANQQRLAPLSRLLLLVLSVVPNAAVGAELSAELLNEADPLRCRDAFDPGLKKQCMREWEQKYYFDAESRECRLFWYDGCPGLTGSRNFFDSLLECQWLCEPGQSQRSEICLQPFDEHLRDECDALGNWRRHFYFDRIQRRCVPFWFDGCDSPYGNHFEDKTSCRLSCELASGETVVVKYQTAGTKHTKIMPAWRLISTTLTTTIRTTNGTISGKTPRHWPHRQQQTPKVQTATNTAIEAVQQPQTRKQPNSSSEPPPPRTSALSPPAMSSPRTSASLIISSSAASSSSSASVPLPSSSPSPPVPKRANDYDEQRGICAQNNPCQNGGTCVYDVLVHQPICKCASPFTNDFCTERIDFDPCSPNPCKNGATCSAIAGPQRTDFDCFCARGFAGRLCEFRPCDDNPCKNGGTCRTSRSQSLFFCACKPDWGGKTCMIDVSSSAEISDVRKPLLLESANLSQQLSSGRAEWIEELKRVTPRMPNSESVEEQPNSGEDGSGKSANAYRGADSQASSRRFKGQQRPAPSSSVVGFPREQIVGQELPTRTLKGTTAEAAANDEERRKNSATNARERNNAVFWNALAICFSLINKILMPRLINANAILPL